MITATIRTENMGAIDSDNIRYSVSVLGGNNHVLIKGEAQYIISGDYFHLNSDLEEKCEQIGLEPSDLQEALEERSETVGFTNPSKKYAISQAEFDACLKFYRNAFDFDSVEPFISIQLDEEHKVEIYRDESRQPKPIYFGVETISGVDIPLDDLACNEFLDFIVHEMPYKASDLVVFSPDLSSVDYPTSAQIVVDVEYNLQTLIDAGETAQSMANCAQGFIEDAIGNGILSANNYEVEIDSYDISLVKPSKVKETPSLTTESKPVELYSVSEKAFKNSAKRLREALSGMGLEINHAKTLQVLSQAIYAKPFEEVKATTLKEAPGLVNEDIDCSKHEVALIEALGELMLFVDGDFVTSTYDRTDMEQSSRSVMDQAEREAERFNTTVSEGVFSKEGELGEWYYEDLSPIFTALGLLNAHKPSLFGEIENGSAFEVDGLLTHYGLDDDWRANFADSGYDLETGCWNIEVSNDDGLYEFFFNVENLVNAKKQTDGSWSVTDIDGESIVVRVLN